MERKDVLHWADSIAKRIINEKGDKESYSVAAGISPSGTVHIGNFREIITVDLVRRALESAGKKVRFIYSWDDYDVLRKIPKNMPKQDLLKKYLGSPISDVPDTFGCHKSYAEHNEKEVEDVLPVVAIKPEFLYQNKKYKNCEYAKEIRTALKKAPKIREILNKYRKEQLVDNWLPIVVYCKKCSKQVTENTKYLGNYDLSYKCECGHEDTIDFRKDGIVKLRWRIDWGMRWHHEKVDFEPGGKEHSTPGGSLTTAREIIKEVYNEEAPIYQPYDFIIVKGKGGKMSSSLGNVITLKDALDIYEPEIIRYLFASTRPNTEFFISFDLDVLKNYEDFDRLERVYFKKEKVKEEKYKKLKRIYELSCIEMSETQSVSEHAQKSRISDIPKKLPYQPSFRHLTNVVQIFEGDFKQISGFYQLKNKKDIDKLRERAVRVKNWLEKYATDDFKFKVNKEGEVKKLKLNEKEKESLKLLKEKLKNKYNEKTLFEEFYNIIKKIDIDSKDFFKAAYKVLINKEKGPKLAPFILALGNARVVKLLNSL